MLINKMDPIFRKTGTDKDSDPSITQIESLCMNCGENGTTTLLLTEVPFYKNVVIMSFECTHCGLKNNELQCSSQIPLKGIRYELHVETAVDLNRTIVRSDYTSITIPHLDFEIPSGSQKGDITTIEGIIDRSILGLSQDQNERKKSSPEIASKIEQLIQKLEELKDVKAPFTIKIEDISGNSFLSNLNSPNLDPNVKSTVFVRTKEQDHTLGIYEHSELRDSNTTDSVPVEDGENAEPITNENIHDEVLHLPDNCPSCGAPCPVNMKLQSIPFFKEVIIIAINCDKCGYRSNEVKSGAGIEPKGIKISVIVSESDDFCRDVLKSDTCTIAIPEIEVEVGAAAMSGRFTTIEGILVSMKEQLQNSHNIFTDSADSNSNARMGLFIQKLDDLLAQKSAFTLILDDPAGNSFIQSKTPPNPDNQLKIEYYERSVQQNEDLGLNDMKVENYS